MSPEALSYLAARLSRIGGSECTLAFSEVAAALADQDKYPRSSEAEHGLCHVVWDHVSRALDHDEVPAHRDELESIEAEMAGRVLMSRMERGLLVARPESGERLKRQRLFNAIFG
jgi:hypothetical protein